MIFLSKCIRKQNITKFIFLNAKTNEVTEVNEMKNEYQNVADVRIEKIIMLINLIVDDKKRMRKQYN